MRIPFRRAFWLSAAAFILVVVCAGFVIPRSRITWENFKRIQRGMKDDEVSLILGPFHSCQTLDTVAVCEWEEGRYWIGITFDHSKVCEKSFRRATPLEYVKRCAGKVGIRCP